MPEKKDGDRIVTEIGELRADAVAVAGRVRRCRSSACSGIAAPSEKRLISGDRWNPLMREAFFQHPHI
jgi:hypothetical protein